MDAGSNKSFVEVGSEYKSQLLRFTNTVPPGRSMDGALLSQKNALFLSLSLKQTQIQPGQYISA